MNQTTSFENYVAYEVIRKDRKENLAGQFPPRPEVFVDRTSEVSKILRYLNPYAAPKGIFIFGQGGVGKTTLAIETAYRAWQRGDYDELLFLTAKKSYWDIGEKREIITHRGGKYQFASFKGMSRRLAGILHSPGVFVPVSESEVWREIYHALSDRRVLLLIDNLDSVSESEVAKFEHLVNFSLPKHNKAIITSRVKWPALIGYGLIEVKLDSLDESARYAQLMALQRKHNTDIPLQAVSRLLTVSQGNPLIMEQIVTLIPRRGVGDALAELESLEQNKLLPFIFDSSLQGVQGSRGVLFAIAVATFPVTLRFLVRVLKLPPNEVREHLSILERWSLIIKRDVEHGEAYYDVHFRLEDYVIDLLKRTGNFDKWKQRVRMVELEE